MMQRIVTRAFFEVYNSHRYVENGGITPLNPTDDDLNVPSPRTEGAPDFDARKPEASINHIREMLDQTRHTLLRTQRRIERNERHWKSLSRQLTALWVFVIMVIVGFGLLTWYQLYQLLVQKKP
jgi:hypothetical protein